MKKKLVITTITAFSGTLAVLTNSLDTMTVYLNQTESLQTDGGLKKKYGEEMKIWDNLKTE